MLNKTVYMIRNIKNGKFFRHGIRSRNGIEHNDAKWVDIGEIYHSQLIAIRNALRINSGKYGPKKFDLEVVTFELNAVGIWTV